MHIAWERPRLETLQHFDIGRGDKNTEWWGPVSYLHFSFSVLLVVSTSVFQSLFCRLKSGHFF
jgi:hypothetical protein